MKKEKEEEEVEEEENNNTTFWSLCQMFVPQLSPHLPTSPHPPPTHTHTHTHSTPTHPHGLDSPDWLHGPLTPFRQSKKRGKHLPGNQRQRLYINVVKFTVDWSIIGVSIMRDSRTKAASPNTGAAWERPLCFLVRRIRNKDDC